MTGRFSGLVVFAFVAPSIGACKPIGGDGKPNDPIACAPAASSSPEAANAGDVSRFPDEVPFGPSAVVAHDRSRVAKTPGGADLVGTLPAGFDVIKLAARGTQDLVCFDEPKPGTRHLMGWIAQSDLIDDAPPAPATEDAGPPAPPDPPDPPDPPPHKGGHHHKQPHKKQRQ
jgi:hypothetical protein